MFTVVLLIAAAVTLSARVVLGWVPDTREPDRLTFPAGPDEADNTGPRHRDCGRAWPA